MKCQSVVAALAVAAITCSSLANSAPADTMLPGLWQTSSKVDSGNSEMGKAMAMMQQQMGNMGPEQRAALQAMVSKHGGGQLPPMTVNGDGSVAMPACITKEMIAKSMVPVPTQGNCTQKNSPVVGGVLNTTFSCTNPPSSGDARFQFTGGKAYTMTMNTVSTVNGQPHTMAVTGSGQWVSADCGSVKPLTAPVSAPK